MAGRGASAWTTAAGCGTGLFARVFDPVGGGP
jgi:hypothetical protein